MSGISLTFHPLTAERWNDLVTLFGDNGACGGCWCMYWRLNRKDFDSGKGTKSKNAMKRLVKSGPPPGILAYHNNRPVGWCSIGPNGDFLRFKTARTIKPIDNKPVWSLVCLFVQKEYRDQGVSTQLIEAACRFARKQGATIAEAYPVDPAGMMPPPFVYTGLLASFEKTGFKVVKRTSKTRAIVRKNL